jgi:hypothetical protein
MIQTAISIASTRSAPRQPSPSMRSCVSGTSAKIPTPIPADAAPRAVPTRDGNQARMSTTDGTQPAALMPRATSTPNTA